MSVQKGDRAPDFSLKDKDGQEVGLSSFRGQWVVLYFYPRDNTAGCTQEARDFTERMAEFEKKEAVIIGISPDSEKSHARFAEKHGLSVLLLSDPDHKALESYGVWRLKKMAGREYMGVIRSTFLIDPEGVVRDIWDKVRVKNHAEEVRERLCTFVSNGE